jgi:hypothetical protein
VPINVFTKYPAGPHLVNNSEHLRPEPTVIRFASALPGVAFRLAGVAAGNNVNSLGVLHMVDVMVLVCMREVLAADCVAERVYLAGPGGADAGPLRCECKAADSVEQRAVGQAAHAAWAWAARW